MGGLFSTKAPKPAPVAVMPDEEDPAIKQRRRMAAAEAQSRSGRTSTILSTRNARSQGAAPGTTPYNNSLLGQA